MNFDLIIGSLVALFAYLLMVGLVFYNRRLVESIFEKNISHIRQIKSEMKRGKETE